jgi:hypothetical protein
MDKERFQQIEERLNEQVEATRAMNETLNKFIVIMGSNQEAARNIAPPSPQLVITPLQASQPSRVKLGVPSNFDRDRDALSSWPVWRVHLAFPCCGLACGKV